GWLVRTRTSTVSRDRSGAIVAQTTISDTDGRAVGRASSRRLLAADGGRMSATSESDGEVVTVDYGSEATTVGRKIGHKVTQGSDGSRTTTDWTHYEDGTHRQTETIERGSTTTTVETVTVPREDGSASHTEVVTHQGDGTTTRTVSDSQTH